MKHEKKLNDNSTNKTLIEAVKRGADLQDADLQDADLQGADLQGAYLQDADLQGADLRGADLQGAGLVQIVGIGSEARCTTFDVKNRMILCGCYYASLEEFKKRVNDAYPHPNKWGNQYRAFIKMVEELYPQSGKNIQ